MNIVFKNQAAKKAFDRFIKIESAQIESFMVSDFVVQYKKKEDGVEFWLKARPQSTIKFKNKDVELLRQFYRNKGESKPQKNT
jgi:hypothetical protein